MCFFFCAKYLNTLCKMFDGASCLRSFPYLVSCLYHQIFLLIQSLQEKSCCTVTIQITGEEMAAAKVYTLVGSKIDAKVRAIATLEIADGESGTRTLVVANFGGPNLKAITGHAVLFTLDASASGGYPQGFLSHAGLNSFHPMYVAIRPGGVITAGKLIYRLNPQAALTKVRFTPFLQPGHIYKIAEGQPGAGGLIVHMRDAVTHQWHDYGSDRKRLQERRPFDGEFHGGFAHVRLYEEHIFTVSNGLAGLETYAFDGIRLERCSLASYLVYGDPGNMAQIEVVDLTAG